MIITLEPLPTFTVTKDQTAPSGPPNSIRPLVVIGATGVGTAAAPSPHVSPGAAKSEFGQCAFVEAGSFALSDHGGVSLVHFVSAGNANAGTYGTVTKTFDETTTGIVVASPTVKPTDGLQVKVVITNGFSVGNTGGKYKFTLDGEMWYSEREIGTSTSIDLSAYGAGEYVFIAPLATTISKFNDIRAKFLAHVAESGTYHTAADPSSPYAIPVATNEATLLTGCGNLYASVYSHALTIGTTHGLADAATVDALNDIGAPTTYQQAVTFLTTISTIIFGNGINANSGHTVRTSPAVHLAVDVINQPQLFAQIGGEFKTNDEFSVETKAATPDVDGLRNAIRSLRSYPLDFGVILFADELNGSLTDIIAAELKDLWKYGKFRDAVVCYRIPNVGETVVQYKSSFGASFGSVKTTDVRAIGGAVRLVSPNLTASGGNSRPLRSPGWMIAARIATIEPQQLATEVRRGRYTGASIRDSSGKAIPRCFDETDQPWSVEVRGVGVRTWPQLGDGVYVNHDELLYELDSPWVLGPYTRVVNHLIETAQGELIRLIGSGFIGDPGSPLPEDRRTSLQLFVQNKLDKEGPEKGRCTSVRIVLNPDAGLNGRLGWTMTVVPLTYIVNGVSLSAKIGAITVSGAVQVG